MSKVPCQLVTAEDKEEYFFQVSLPRLKSLLYNKYVKEYINEYTA